MLKITDDNSCISNFFLATIFLLFFRFELVHPVDWIPEINPENKITDLQIEEFCEIVLPATLNLACSRYCLIYKFLSFLFEAAGDYNFFLVKICNIFKKDFLDNKCIDRTFNRQDITFHRLDIYRQHMTIHGLEKSGKNTFFNLSGL